MKARSEQLGWTSSCNQLARDTDRLGGLEVVGTCGGAELCGSRDVARPILRQAALFAQHTMTIAITHIPAWDEHPESPES